MTYYAGNGTSIDKHSWEVKLGTDVADVSSFTLSIGRHEDVSVSTDWELVNETEFSVAEAGDYRVGFYGFSQSTYASFKLDNLSIVNTSSGINDVAVDGGMADNPRYALYGADYEIVVANKADKPRDLKVTVAGKCCESGDLIQENTMIQTPCAGDTLAVLATGAYNYSMASNYNRICRPAAVMLKSGEARVVIRRETFEDLVRNDI